jgi:exonuclease-1
MNCLRTKGIDFVVAPYEADSQIGKMVENGEVEAAISEDSDLLLYCNKVILKLELSGKCDYIDLEKIDR